jgi:hypothetical protein
MDSWLKQEIRERKVTIMMGNVNYEDWGGSERGLSTCSHSLFNSQKNRKLNFQTFSFKYNTFML